MGRALWSDIHLLAGGGRYRPRVGRRGLSRAFRELGPFEYHANVVKPGDETAAVDPLAARGTVAEADDVGTVLPQPGEEGQALGVVDEGHEARFAVAVVAHEDREFTALGQSVGRVLEEHTVALEEELERRRA